MGCFSAVMQWHAEPRSGQFFATNEKTFNNDRSPWNLARYWEDDRLLDIACDFARLRQRLMPYILDEARLCVEDARPMMAHLCLDFPEDPEAWTVDDEYMLGRKMLVAPIVEEGASGREVYLPKGQWKDFFTGEILCGAQHIFRPCGLDRIPVFERCEADA